MNGHMHAVHIIAIWVDFTLGYIMHQRPLPQHIMLRFSYKSSASPSAPHPHIEKGQLNIQKSDITTNLKRLVKI